MIQVQDLCVGNWVYDGERTQFPMFIRAIGEDYVYLDFEGNEGDLWESKPEDLVGIPITVELLTKNGFADLKIEERKILAKKMTLSERKTIQVSHSVKYGTATILELISGREYDKLLESIMCNITFLHELQNFYRLTTKQELKINL